MNSEFNPYDKFKSPWGRYPVTSATAKGGGDDPGPTVTFTYTSTDGGSETVSLEDLACCYGFNAQEGDTGAMVRGIESFAHKSGPLFGEAADEPIVDWQIAVGNAQKALFLQECVNGSKPINLASQLLAKEQVFKPGDSKPLFTAYFLSLIAGCGGESAYERMLSPQASVHAFRQEGRHDYAFVLPDTTDEETIIDICLVSCDEQLSTVAFAGIACYLQYGEIGAERLRSADLARFDLDIEQAFEQAAQLYQADSVSIRETPVIKEDGPQIEHVVQTIASLHFRGVHIDLFQADNSTDYLSFDCFLESLWYEFAKRLKLVKVGYCAECGKGFSLTGHRGEPREYCSEKCRTKAKNAREKKKRDQARKLYLEGASIEDAIRQCYPDTSERVMRNRLVATLHSWPALKQAVSRSMAKGDSSLAKRCLADGVFTDKELLRLAKRR